MQEPITFETSDDAENAFYEAFQQLDIELMMTVWANTQDITCIHPGGTRLEGQLNIRDSWQKIFSQDNGIKFEINQKKIVKDGNIAIHHVIEAIYMDGELQSEILATNIFRNESGSWHMILHHASPELRPAILHQEEEDDSDIKNKTFH